MMRFYLIVLILIFNVSSVSTQSIKSYGLRIGSNLSTAIGDLTDERYIASFMIGASLTFEIDEHLSFRPEICYSNKGYKYTHEEPAVSYIIESEFTFRYFEMPFLFVYSLGENFNFIGGAYIEFFSEGTIQDPSYYYGEIDIDSEYVNSPGYGLVLGVEYCTDYAMFGIRYSMGLSKIYNSSSSDLKHQVFQFTIGFNVPIGKKEKK
ncbi:MAG: porin family protein [Candidatus Delongbacteria bacterium]|jgi:hypothetical protein|nr:porin family protein [Candidatus Delongbacteria bacterium]